MAHRLLLLVPDVCFPNWFVQCKEDFAKMRRKIEGFLLLVTLVVLIAGCDNTTNDNRTANANTNANANATATVTPISTPVTSANDNRRAPTREEYEANKERYNREAKESGRTVGTGLNDGWLWVKTRFDLAAADDLRDSTINVDVDKNVVTLTGTVASAAQKAKAESVAKSVEGVTSVKNMLKVQAANANANANKPKANANK
jgi:osmotically-inducible protein OsmY